MVTVHVGTDQNIEIEIFAEYEYTLNELPVKKCFNTSNSLRDMANKSFYDLLPEVNREPSSAL